MFLRFLLVCASALLSASVVNAKSYCDVEGGYSEAEATAAVDAHNSFRTKMANGTFEGANGELPSKAANMRRMSWSCELQKSAQDWANKCKSGSSGTDYAESLYTMDSTSLASRYEKANGSASMVSEYWLKQYVDKGFKELKFAEGVKRAATMAWAETNQLGCGVKVCPDLYKNAKGVMQHRLFIVCHYNPNNNENARDTAYKIGEPCSDCGSYFGCEKDGGVLCVARENPEQAKVDAANAKKMCDIKDGYSIGKANAALDAHNTFRTELAKGTFEGLNGELSPKASNMRRMKWSCKLQKTAQEIANQCSYSFSNYSNVYGENLYMMDATSLKSRYKEANGSALMVSLLWQKPYIENGFMDLKDNWSVHMAYKMAWADSYQMGCGFKVCENNKNVNGVMWHRLSVACQYNPKGNGNAIGGDIVYKKGEPCSDCGQAFECEKTGGTLCVRQKLPDGTDVPFKPLPDTIGHCNVKNGYDEENVNYIVDTHNKIRSEMARGVFGGSNGKEMSQKASNMKKMAWNCSLQETSQWWAENGACLGNHSEIGGENMWMLDTPTLFESWIDPKLDKRVNGSGQVASESWANEFVAHGFNNLTYEYITGHALAVSWAGTNQIGCGYHICDKPKLAKGSYWHRIVVVCQYRPNPNVIGYQAYKFGEPCSNCDKGFTCEKTGSVLCVHESENL